MTLRFQVYTAAGRWLGRHTLSLPAARRLQERGYELYPVTF